MQGILHKQSTRMVLALAILAMVFSTLMSALLVSPVSAAQVTSRSITMGSSAAGATTTINVNIFACTSVSNIQMHALCRVDCTTCGDLPVTACASFIHCQMPGNRDLLLLLFSCCDPVTFNSDDNGTLLLLLFAAAASSCARRDVRRQISCRSSPVFR